MQSTMITNWGYFRNVKGYTSVSLTLTTTESQPVPYTVDAPGVAYYNNGIIAANNVTTVSLPEEVIALSHTERDKGIHAGIQSDQVSLIAQSLYPHSSDTFLCTTNYHHYSSKACILWNVSSQEYNIQKNNIYQYSFDSWHKK